MIRQMKYGMAVTAAVLISFTSVSAAGPPFTGVAPFSGDFSTDPNWDSLAWGNFQVPVCVTDHTNSGGTKSALLNPTLGNRSLISITVQSITDGYTLNFWCKGSWSAGHSLNVSLGNQVLADVFTINPTWTKVSYTNIPVASGTVTLTFNVSNNSGSSSGVQVDAVQLIPNTSPTNNFHPGDFTIVRTPTNTFVVSWRTAVYGPRFSPQWATSATGPWYYKSYAWATNAAGFAYFVDPHYTGKMFYRLLAAGSLMMDEPGQTVDQDIALVAAPLAVKSAAVKVGARTVTAMQPPVLPRLPRTTVGAKSGM